MEINLFSRYYRSQPNLQILLISRYTITPCTGWKSVRWRKGACTIVQIHPDTHKEILYAPCNVQSRVHEYGGGEWALTEDKIFFCNSESGHIDYSDGQSIHSLTKIPGVYFADLTPDPVRPRLYGGV